MKIISGNSNIELSKEISEYLKIQLSEATMTRFSDKEIFVEIGENVKLVDLIESFDAFIFCLTSDCIPL